MAERLGISASRRANSQREQRGDPRRGQFIAMESVEFRLATAADVESLVALRAAFLAELTGCDPHDPALLNAMSQYFSETVPTGEFIAYLAVVDGRVVSTSGLIIHRNPPSARNPEGREAFVINMYTVPAWRGRGLASSLLQLVVAAARQARCSRVILHAAPRAVPIYSRAGFVSVSTEMRLDLC
jgi:GNAT superfamily N-acetyltransferase